MQHLLDKSIHNVYCLSICRPAATEVMKQLENAYEIEEDPYSEINLVDLIRKTGREANLAYSTLFSESLEHSPLKNRLEAIKVASK